MDASELLKTQTIHYLHPETIRSFSELLILSAEGRRFSLNPLVLFSKSPLLRDLFLEEELLSDRVLLTNIPEADLEVVLESLVKGEEVFSPLRIQGVKSALEALGLSKDSQGGHSFTYKDEPIKMELQDDAQETTHIKEEQQDGEEAGGLVVAIVAATQENNSPTEARHLQNNSQEETDPLMLVKPTLQCINCGQYNNIDSERNHASSNPFHTPECNHPDCEDRFSSYSEHLDHVKSAHEGQFHFKCGLCGDLFPDVPSFTSHKKAVHHASTKRKISDRSALINKEKSVCKLCGKRLLRCNMTAHIKIVHGNDPVNCSICNKTFNHPMALKLHGDSTHREFPCGKCGDMCRSPKAYKQHILTKHTPPELLPYQCVDCGKAFTTAYMFKQHENMHRGIKPHACKFCGKAFGKADTRNQHEKSMHLGDKRIQTKKKGEPSEENT